MATAWRSLLSPYQSNPLDINPLRDLLEREIDFDAIASSRQLKVFVSATHVNTGRAVIFTGAPSHGAGRDGVRLPADAVQGRTDRRVKATGTAAIRSIRR